MRTTSGKVYEYKNEVAFVSRLDAAFEAGFEDGVHGREPHNPRRRHDLVRQSYADGFMQGARALMEVLS